MEKMEKENKEILDELEDDEYKICVQVEYEDNENALENFELFDDLEKAYKFGKSVIIKKIDLVKVNKKNLYYEDDGSLNYEDTYELFHLY